MNLIPRSFNDFFLEDDMEDFAPTMMHDSMRCDIYEKDGDYHMEIDIPGFKKEDISIDCDNGYLTVSAEKTFEENDETKKYIRRERSYGKYQRSFYVGDIDSSKIKAEFKHGILKITVPKTSAETKKHIEIEG